MEEIEEAVAPRETNEDAELRLLFLCCHPVVHQVDHLIMILKHVGGFGNSEIGRALFLTESAVAQRIVRARQRIRESDIKFEVPSESALLSGRESILRALYLIFNEGYSPTRGEGRSNIELCETAISLAERFGATSVGSVSSTQALLALMGFHRARALTRVDGEGVLIPLEDQPRSEWDEDWINKALRHLDLSMMGRILSPYHFEAGIAAAHTLADDFESTDWREIVWLYGQLLRLSPSLPIAINRALSQAMAYGYDMGSETLNQLEGADLSLQFWVARAWLTRKQGGDATPMLLKALELTQNEAEIRYLKSKL